ncbi:MAG: hypothetical protein ACLRMJ_06160 [Alistipes finegoldii]
MKVAAAVLLTAQGAPTFTRAKSSGLGHQIQRRRICPHPDPVGQGGQRTGFGKPLARSTCRC